MDHRRTSRLPCITDPRGDGEPIARALEACQDRHVDAIVAVGDLAGPRGAPVPSCRGAGAVVCP